MPLLRELQVRAETYRGLQLSTANAYLLRRQGFPFVNDRDKGPQLILAGTFALKQNLKRTQ